MKGGFFLRDISERVSYLQGLSEGLNISDNNPQGKIINGILSVMHNIYEEINDLQEELDMYKEYTESLEDNYTELEKMLEITPEEIRKVHFTCDNCGTNLSFNLALAPDEDVIEIICPECNEVIYINDDESTVDYDSYAINENESREMDSLQQH